MSTHLMEDESYETRHSVQVNASQQVHVFVSGLVNDLVAPCDS